jgi:hypothetical protein
MAPLIILLALALAGAATPEAQADTAKHRFDIPAQPLGAARRPPGKALAVLGRRSCRSRRGSLRVPESPYPAMPAPSDRCADRSPPRPAVCHI